MGLPRNKNRLAFWAAGACLVFSASAQGQLNPVALTLSDSAVVSISHHTCQWVSTQSLPADGQIRFAYWQGFVLNTDSIRSTTIDGTFSFSVSDSVLTVTRNGDGTPAASGSLDLTLYGIVNDTTAGTGSVSVETRNASSVILESGSASLTLLPGPLNDFSLSGEPASIQAGTAFSASIIATAFDMYGNIKTNYTGQVYFTSSDGQAQLNFHSGNPYTFLSGDNGTRSFPGSGFELRTAGSQTISVTDGTISRSSAAISVTPGGLVAFTLTGVPAGLQAGRTFPSSVTVTAFDAYNNIKTDYTGQVYFTSTDPQAQITVDASNPYTFILSENGVHSFSGGGFELRTAGSQTITVQDGMVTRTSGLITVSADALDSFTLSVDPGNKTAGVSFPLYVTGAQDQYGNAWTGAVNITLPGGSHESPTGYSPTLNGISVSAGSGQSNQTLVLAESGVTIQAQSGAVSRTVTGVQVVPNNLASLIIRNASGNGGTAVGSVSMNAGTTLTLYSAGYDLYGNYRTDENTNWTSDGTLNPAVNTSNTASVDFIPTRPGTGTIRSQSPSNPTIYDNTGTIQVQSGTVSYFTLDPIDTQVEGDPFTIAIQARDAQGNIASGFSGTVQISDLTGTIRRTESGTFSQGIWSGGVTVYQSYSNNRITVTETGAPSPAPSGSSNTFDVLPSPGVRITGFQPLSTDTVTAIQTVTAGQTREWFLKVLVENYAGTDVILDSLQLQFMVDGFVRTDYSTVLPDTFWFTGGDTLYGGTVDSLLLKVTATGQSAGFGNIQGFVYMTAATGRFISLDTLTSLTIQTPAALQIEEVRLSQDEVTRQQTSPWTVRVILRNTGQSHVLIDSAAVDNCLSFGLGAGWLYNRPSELQGGGWILEGMAADTLLFLITRSGDQIGTSTVDARVQATETNSGRSIGLDTSGGGGSLLVVETAPVLDIVEIQNLAVNSPYVSTQQAFQIRVRVENRGDDGIHNAVIHMLTELSNFPALTPVSDIGGHEVRDVIISGTASSTAMANENLIFHLSGAEDNTQNAVSSGNDTLQVTVQNPANLFIERVVPSVGEVWGGQVDPWTIKVGIRNTGQAVLRIDKPQAADCKFYVDGQLQTDYVVIPDTVLMGGNRNVYWGSRDTLVFRVMNTGRLGGTVQVRTTVRGWDGNDPSRTFVDEGNAVFTVRAEPDFRIISTRLRTPNTTEAGNGYVNTNQIFEVVSVVENGLGATLSNIQLRLESSGLSISGYRYSTLSRLQPATRDSVIFSVTAASIKALSGETFTSRIVQAVYESSGYPAPVGPALDSTAVAYIQSPAQVSLSLSLSREDGVFSSGEQFQVRANLNYTDTGMSAVDSSARVQLTIPSGYTLLSSLQTVYIYPGTSAEWTVQAPPAESATATISAMLVQYPLDRNSRQTALVSQAQASRSVRTLKSNLSMAFSIFEPAGAVDGVLSTQQSFVVQAVVQQINVKDIQLELTLPFGYTTSDNLIKQVRDDPQIRWQVRAPAEPTSVRVLQVSGRGVDALVDDNEVFANPEYIDVQTIQRADLFLDLSTQNNSVSLGQEFFVTAELRNLGAAGVQGQAEVTLDPLPDAYTTTDPMTRSVPQSGQVSWNIKAPTQPTREAVNIEARLSRIPVDENTNETAFVSRASDKVAVTTVGSWLSLSRFARPDTVSGLILQGQKGKWMGGLQMINRGETGANAVVIHSIRFDLMDYDGNPASPGSLFSRIRAVPLVRDTDTSYVDTTQVFGELQNNIPGEGSLLISFTRPASITARDTLFMIILGDISAGAPKGNYVLNIKDESYIDARDEYSTYVNIAVLDETGNPFHDLKSDPKQVLPSEIQEREDRPYLINCPNPFGAPGHEQTWFIYYLNQASDVEFRIYTLTGKLVWSRSYSASDPEGLEGLHDRAFYPVIWDGRNDNGHRVLNGVYILMMKTETGVSSTKIAVMK